MPTPTYIPIVSQTLTAATSTVTFSSIPQDYKHLVLTINLKMTSSDQVFLKVNGSSTGYSYIYTRARDKAVGGSSGTTTSGLPIFVFNALPSVTWSNSKILFTDYSDSSKSTTTAEITGWANSGSSSYRIVGGACNRWATVAAITSLSITSATNFAIDSSFCLYGIAG